MEEDLPITERSNPLTQNIDIASPEEIFNILCQCDLQIFNGWSNNYSYLQDKQSVAKIEEISQIATKMLHDDDSCIVLSGCGTSGRLAFLTARNFEELWTETECGRTKKLSTKFEYLIAGGDIALFKSQESPEDDFQLGRITLEKVAASRTKLLFIGITCGLSAAFVAGQLDFCLQHRNKCIPVLLGFNPVNLARTEPMKGVEKSFRDVAKQIEEHGYILNPVIGPEPITGSSRMKGGTATKIILDCILILAHMKYMNKDMDQEVSVSQLLNMYKKAHEITYSNPSSISEYVPMAAQSLQNNGHIYYLGWGSEGIFCLIDASECVPTFGAKFDDIRAFIHNGYETLRNNEGDLSGSVEQMNISFDYFVKAILPSLSNLDTVFFFNPPADNQEIYISSDLKEIFKILKLRGARYAIITVSTSEHKSNIPSVYVNLQELKLMVNKICTQSKRIEVFLLQSLKEIAYKWLLNYISTAAYILSGKVFNNLMVDLKLSNFKLFHRGVSIVSTLANVPTDKAYRCIVMAINSTACLDTEWESSDVSLLIDKASVMDKIIPKAILLSTNKFTQSDAEAALEDNPVIRLCMLKHLQKG